MSYVVAAYTVTGVTLVLYWIHLARESRTLKAEIAERAGSAGEADRNTG